MVTIPAWVVYDIVLPTLYNYHIIIFHTIYYILITIKNHLLLFHYTYYIFNTILSYYIILIPIDHHLLDHL